MPTQNKRVLLISNSTLYGTGYLDHAEAEIRDFLATVKSVLFVPYAVYERDEYAEMASERFDEMGYELTSVHDAADPVEAVNTASAIFIGGGNTFRLLKSLYEVNLIEP